jgi:P-type Cu+ transporter
MSTTIDLEVGGMTCTSCAARIEKKLNRLDGVVASVNYATEQASVRYDESRLGPGDLVAVVEQTGYSARVPRAVDAAANEPADADDESSALRRRLLVSAVLAVPVLILAMVPPARFTGWRWVSLALATPAVFWGGWPFHRATWLNLRHGATTMDTLVSLGTLAAFAWSGVVVLSSSDGELYFEVASVVVVFLLAGRYLEARAKRRSGAALHALLELGAKDVAVLRAGEQTRIPVAELLPGEVFVVRPGEKVATDGLVVEGTSTIDRSLLTGESVPVDVGPGDAVVGATVNAGGRLLVRATRVGAETTLAQMSRLVLAAQSGKAPVQRLADRISMVFVPAVLALAVLTLCGWLLTGADADAAFTAAVAVLIIACPCALGLATPTALLVGTGRGAQLGLLIRGPEVLESTRRVDTVVLDKTGTVTSGRMTLRSVVAAAGSDEAEVLRFAGAVEAASEHPIATAIAAGAREAGPLAPVTAFRSLTGLGVTGTVDGHDVVVGRPGLLAEHGLPLDDVLTAAVTQAQGTGGTVVAIGWAGRVRGLLIIGDTVKQSSRPAVERLRALGLRPMLLTGDNRAAADTIAAEVGIDTADVVAEVLPADKARVITDLQAQGRVVAMVGDGVNDAAALATADLGLSMGTGTDVAIEASDLTLVRGDLTAAADAIRLSRRTLATIKGNLFWAFAYNVVLIPVAAVGLLSPMFAGAAMAFSSVFVVTNSLRLRRWTPA